MTNPYLNKDIKDEKISNSNVKNAMENQDNFLQNLMPNFDTANFIKGILVGATASYILTNENAQQAIFKSIVKMGKLLQAGTEELKERFEDAKAEIEAEE